MRCSITLVVLGAMMLGTSLSNPADPESPRPSPSNSRRGSDCRGFVGFSAIGLSRVNPTGTLAYRQVPFSRNIVFNSEMGNFVVNCPGYYQISFAGYGNTPNLRLILKKKSSKTNQWTSVASAGGTISGGGANQVVLSLAENEECAVFLDSGHLDASLDRSAPSTSFTAVRLNEN